MNSNKFISSKRKKRNSLYNIQQQHPQQHPNSKVALTFLSNLNYDLSSDKLVDEYKKILILIHNKD